MYAYLQFIVFFLLSSCVFLPSGKVSRYKNYFPDSAFCKESKLKVTYFGTSTLLFEEEDEQILIDGFFSRPNVFKVAFGKVQCDTQWVRQLVDNFSITKLKAIFVCHSHYDHSMDAPYLAKITGATIYGSSSTLNVARGYGLPENQMKEFSPNETYYFKNFQVFSSKSSAINSYTTFSISWLY
jgi:L-ascorbate metabolism protein UlaG (beta-lactamase superfamily)